MSANRRISAEHEPLGIIISGGAKSESTPAFVAYVWGPVPDHTPDTPEAKAA